MSARRLFGTDGIRGVAGQSPLTDAEVRLLGRAAGTVLRSQKGGEALRVFAVRDPRWSGSSLLDALSDGLRETGVDVFDGGVLSTPSVAHMVVAHRFQSGVVISASHNPPEFNGIKFFTSEGRKWPDEWEREVERLFASATAGARANGDGHRIDARELRWDYEDFVVGSLPAGLRFDGLRVALDCSNGANHQVAPEVFTRLGAEVIAIGVSPNGRNINVDCGSQHTDKLARTVRAKRCHMGIAFDGDGDRVIFVDEKGAEVDGDQIIAMLARHGKSRGWLAKNLVVITIMANLGLKKALRSWGIKTQEVSVGDRYVSEAMKATGAVLGGEQSGHIILGRYLPTGDGLLTALHTVAASVETGRSISEMAACMRKYPQVLKNVRVAEKRPLEEMASVQTAIRSAETKLGEDGRVLVRYSGTEPLLRIMLEGPDTRLIDDLAGHIATAVEKSAS